MSVKKKMTASIVMHAVIQIVQKAARFLQMNLEEMRDNRFNIKEKIKNTNQAIQQVENLLKSELITIYPNSSIASNIASHMNHHEAANHWLITPLDGFWNYIYGLPTWSLAVALEQDGVLTMSVIYAPILNELFTVEEGKYATFNSQPIKIPNHEQLHDSRIVYKNIPQYIIDHVHMHKLQEWQTHYESICLHKNSDITAHDNCLTLTLAHAALGNTTMITTMVPKHEIAASYLLLKKAGGIMMPDDSNKFIIAGNTCLYGKLNALIKEAYVTIPIDSSDTNP